MANMRLRQVLAGLILLNLWAGAQSQIGRVGNTLWVAPRLDETYQLNGYEVSESVCGDDERPLCDFIKRHFDRQPILFYRHHRGIDLTLGHRKRLVLINDWESTKSARVVVVDLKSGAHKQIDQRAIATYARHVRPDRRLIILPEARGFSPDDRLVLIEMVMEYVSVATDAEAIAPLRTYRPWSYAVEARTGKVIHEYRRKAPPNWW